MAADKPMSAFKLPLKADLGLIVDADGAVDGLTYGKDREDKAAEIVEAVNSHGLLADAEQAMLRMSLAANVLSLADASHRRCCHCTNHPLPENEWAEVNGSTVQVESVLARIRAAKGRKS